MSLLENMPHTCRIQRVRVQNDAAGGVVQTPYTVQSDVECWEQQASSSEILDFQKRGIRVTRKVFFPSNPQIQPRDEIVITSRGGVSIATANEIRLDVNSYPLPDASAGLGVVYRVMCDDTVGDND